MIRAIGHIDRDTIDPSAPMTPSVRSTKPDGPESREKSYKSFLKLQCSTLWRLQLEGPIPWRAPGRTRTFARLFLSDKRSFALYAPLRSYSDTHVPAAALTCSPRSCTHVPLARTRLSCPVRSSALLQLHSRACCTHKALLPCTLLCALTAALTCLLHAQGSLALYAPLRSFEPAQRSLALYVPLRLTHWLRTVLTRPVRSPPSCSSC